MSPQAAWILVNEIVPRLKNAVPRSVNPVGCEDAEELIQDATVTAAKLLISVEQAGKTVTPGNIAFYTIQLMRSGSRSTSSSCLDAMQAGTRLNGRSETVFYRALKQPTPKKKHCGIICYWKKTSDPRGVR